MRHSMGSGASALWGSDVSALVTDVSTLGVGAVASIKRTLG